jgi:hypothetical protein
VTENAHIITSTLSETERFAKAKAEQTIERGLNSFVEVGEALSRVRDMRLYRDEYGTFEEYAERKWTLTRGHAYNLMSAAEQVSAIAGIAPESPKPANLGQARVLSGLPAEAAAEVMRKAHADTDGKVTAKAIKQARDMLTVASVVGPPDPRKTGKPTVIEPPVRADGRRQAGSRSRSKHADVIERLTTSLDGLAMAAREITALDESVTKQEAIRLTDDLSKQIEALNKLNRLLKERTK